MSAALHLRQRALRAATHLPPAVLRAVAGGEVVIDGQRLDPQLAAALRVAGLVAPRLERLEVGRARQVSADGLEAFDADRIAMARIHEDAAPGPAGPVPVRIYVPRQVSGGLIVFFHGGGGVIGSIASYDRACRVLADAAGCAVASVEYRLAPEHPYPAAIDDAMAAWIWAVASAHRWGADPARVAVAGDSFGGYLAAWVDHRSRAAGAPRPRAQVLIYPLVDLTLDAPSYATFAEGFLLTLPLIRWFRDHYAPDPGTHRAGSPRFWPDVAGAAPALIVAAGFDPLRDEGRAWAARLTAAGVPVDYRCHDSLVHGFLTLTGAVDAAREAVLDLGRAAGALVAR